MNSLKGKKNIVKSFALQLRCIIDEVSHEHTWNIMSHEGKHKILYVIDEKTILYDEYMMRMV